MIYSVVSEKEFTFKSLKKEQIVGDSLGGCLVFRPFYQRTKEKLLVENCLVSLQESRTLLAFLCGELISSQWPEMIAVPFNLTGTLSCLFIPLLPLLLPIDALQ